MKVLKYKQPASRLEKGQVVYKDHMSGYSVLKQCKECSCGMIHFGFRSSEGKEWFQMNAVMFNCDCGSSLVVKRSNIIERKRG